MPVWVASFISKNGIFQSQQSISNVANILPTPLRLFQFTLIFTPFSVVGNDKHFLARVLQMSWILDDISQKTGDFIEGIFV